MTRRTAFFVLAAVMAANVAVWMPQFGRSKIDLNDGVLHWTIVREMSQAANPFDFWSPTIALGQPITRYYQPGAHLLVVGVWLALLKSVDLRTVFDTVRWLAIILLPLSIYWCGRMFGLKREEAIGAAALSWLISGDTWGLDPQAYVWAGYGLFPQSVANHTLLASLGLSWAATHGKPKLWPYAALALGATAWTCFLWGWAGGLCVILMALTAQQDRWKAWKTAALIGFGSLWMFLPKLTTWLVEKPLMVAGRWSWQGREWMIYGRGWGEARRLINGGMLDAGRLPVLTVLLFIGMVMVWRRADLTKAYLIFCLWLWLYISFGRTAWGDYITLVAPTKDWQIHRTIGIVQLFAIFIAGCGAAGLYETIRKRATLTGATVAACVILSPAIYATAGYARQNYSLVTSTLNVQNKEWADYTRAIDIARMRGGRVFAGFPQTWGRAISVGNAPLYTAVTREGLESVGLQFVGFLKANDAVYDFREGVKEDYLLYNVRTVIAPAAFNPPSFLTLIGVYGKYHVYAAPGEGYFEGSTSEERVGVSVYRAQVTQPADGSLLFRMAYHPRWIAYVDGLKTYTSESPLGFTAIVVPAGKHEVTVSY